MPRYSLSKASILMACLSLGAVTSSTFAQAPIGDWYGTMSNFQGPRQARVINGVLTISPAQFPGEGPIAVCGDVRTMGNYPNGISSFGALYDLNQAYLGTNYAHPASLPFTFDGTTDGTYNYTVDPATGNVYRLDRDWTNPVFLFNVDVASQGGIAYDCATDTLWVALEGGCQSAGHQGVTGSARNFSMTGTPLSPTIVLGGTSAQLNNLAIDLDGTLWTHRGTDLWHYTAAGVFLNTYPASFGGDSPRGGEISCCGQALVSCPEGALQEFEPCGVDQNGGCNHANDDVQTIECGAQICGSFWWDTVVQNVRDTDWYEFTILTPQVVTWTVQANVDVVTFIFESTCPPTEPYFGSATGPSPVIATTACLPPGTYRAFVAPHFANPPIECSTPQSIYYATLTCEPCPCAPPNMVGWWPLDDAGPNDALEVVIGHDASEFANPPQFNFPGQVDAGAFFDRQQLVVPWTPDYDFGCDAFSGDAWVNTFDSPFGGTIINTLGSGGGGFSFFVDSTGILVLSIEDPNLTLACPVSTSVPVVPSSVWTHVAFTASAVLPGGGRTVTLYVNGIAATAPTSVGCECIDSASPLEIGGDSLVAPGWFGTLDEIEVFRGELTPAEVYALFKFGKWKNRCDVAWDKPYCLNSSSLSTTMTIFNSSSAPQTYLVSATGVASLPGHVCNGPVLTPANFTITPNMLTVGPNSSAPVLLTIARPAGLDPGEVSCYEVTILEDPSGETLLCHGSVTRTNQWCFNIVDDAIIAGPPGVPAVASFAVENTGDTDEFLLYKLALTGPAASVASINGANPGSPLYGQIMLPVGSSTTLEVALTFLEFVPFGTATVLISGDENNDCIPTEVLISQSFLSVPAPPSPPCLGDLDGNGTVGFGDLIVVLSSWGPCVGCAADLDGNGNVGFDDLLTLLASWGPCP